MEDSVRDLVSETLATELSCHGWQPGSFDFLDNGVIFLSASKDSVSYLFQANVRPLGAALINPSVGMHRDPAKKRNRCDDIVLPAAEISIQEDGIIASDGLTNIRKAISDADVMLENRKRFNAKYAPKS